MASATNALENVADLATLSMLLFVLLALMASDWSMENARDVLMDV